MMNRKKLIVGGIIGVIIVFILATVLLTPQEKPPLPAGNQISPTAGQLIRENAPLDYDEFLSSGRSEICTFAVTQENQNVSGLEVPSKISTGTIFAANGKIKGEFTMTTRDGTLQQHVLVDAYTAYLWNNVNNGGVKFLVGKESPDKLIKPPLVYNCKSWTPNNSVFQLPVGVVFTEITDFNASTP